MDWELEGSSKTTVERSFGRIRTIRRVILETSGRSLFKEPRTPRELFWKRCKLLQSQQFQGRSKQSKLDIDHYTPRPHQFPCQCWVDYFLTSHSELCTFALPHPSLYLPACCFAVVLKPSSQTQLSGSVREFSSSRMARRLLLLCQTMAA